MGDSVAALSPLFQGSGAVNPPAAIRACVRVRAYVWGQRQSEWVPEAITSNAKNVRANIIAGPG